MRTITLVAVLTFTSTMAAAQTGPAECAAFADSLDACTPYTCTFSHPFTGAPMERRIVGPRGDGCSYVEQMPGGGSMECLYRPETRRAVAAFFRTTERAQSTRTGAKIDSQGGVSTTTTVDGKRVANPLDAALKSGECKVGGYGGGAQRPPSTAAASAPPSEKPVESVRSTLTLGGKPVELSYAYAFEAPNGSVLLVMSDQVLTPAQARSSTEMEKLMRSSKLHAVAATLDPLSKTATTMHVFDPRHQYAVFVAPSNRALEINRTGTGSLNGKLSTIRPGAFAGAPYEVAVTFNVRPQP